MDKGGSKPMKIIKRVKEEGKTRNE